MISPQPTHPIYAFLLNYRWALFTIAVVVTALAYGPAQRVNFDRSIESMFKADDPLLPPFEQLRRTFGGDQLVLAAYVDPKLLTADGLERLIELQEKLDQVPGVSATLSIANSPAGRKLGGEIGRPIREFFQGLLLDEKGETTAVIVFLQPEAELAEHGSTQADVVAQVRQIMTAHDPTGTVAGEPVMVADGFSYLEGDGWLLGWATTTLLMGVILFSFRNLRWAIIPIVVVQCSLLWTRAVLAMLNLRLSMVSSMLTAIITVIGIATVIHVIIHLREERAQGKTSYQAIGSALAILGLPIVWAVCTDIVGFGSLMVSRVGPVDSFGMMICIGTVCTLIATATMLPALALWGEDGGPKKAWGERHLGAGLDRLATSLHSNPETWGVVSFVALVTCIAGYAWVEVETDFTKNFHSHTPIVQSYRFVESRLGGAGVWDVYLPMPEELDEAYLRKVRQFQDRLRNEVVVKDADGTQRPGLTKVVSVADAIDAAHNFGGALARWMPLRNKLHLIQRTSPSLYAALIGRDKASPDQWYYRIMLRSLEQQSTPAKVSIIQQVRKISQEEYPETAHNTGFFVLLSTLIDSLLSDQWSSFALTAAGIGLMLWLVFRNLKYSLAAVVPNAVPILMVLGLMGWLHLKINMGTVMIAAVSMSMSVDSSIHYLYSYRRQREAGSSVVQAISGAHQSVGLSMIFSTLALIVGFLSLVLSNFVPTNYFGVLVSLSMLGGLVGNLVVLPLLLLFIDREPRAAVALAGAPASETTPPEAPAPTNGHPTSNGNGHAATKEPSPATGVAAEATDGDDANGSAKRANNASSISGPTRRAGSPTAGAPHA